jgi:hypothetical protein
MIAYLPNIYPDEIVYSWCCRYYAHSGYPSYSTALEDLFGNKSYRINYEFSGCFCDETQAIIDKMIKAEDLIERHTMFPYYSRFAPYARRMAAYDALINGNRLSKLLPTPCDKEIRYLMYCPSCATEDRKTYGETYLHRIHQIRHIALCPRHGCKLISTGVRITANASPRLFVTEELVPYDSTPEQVENSSQVMLARYMADVLSQPMPTTETVPIGEYLTHKLRGTPYIIGNMRQIARIHRDLRERFNDFWYKEYHIQKELLGQSIDPHLIVLMAYHLGIKPPDLCNGTIPESDAVSTRVHSREPSSYSTRKGAQVQNWDRLDRECLPRVRQVIKALLVDSTGRPRRVSDRAVCNVMNWPSKRLDYLPMCKTEVLRYHETIQQYWAREIVWAYRKVMNNQAKLNWRAIRDLTNMKRRDFVTALPLLIHYADTETSAKIKSL